MDGEKPKLKRGRPPKADHLLRQKRRKPLTPEKIEIQRKHAILLQEANAAKAAKFAAARNQAGKLTQVAAAMAKIRADAVDETDDLDAPDAPRVKFDAMMVEAPTLGGMKLAQRMTDPEIEAMVERLGFVGLGPVEASGMLGLNRRDIMQTYGKAFHRGRAKGVYNVAVQVQLVAQDKAHPQFMAAAKMALRNVTEWRPEVTPEDEPPENDEMVLADRAISEQDVKRRLSVLAIGFRTKPEPGKG